MTDNADDFTYKLAQDVLKGRFAWLEDGSIPAVRDGSTSPAPASTPPMERNLSDTRVATQIGGGA